MLVLISHAPARLLPTIRSRCRTLACAPLSAEALSAALAGAGYEAEDAVALATLSGGSAGEAVRLIEGGRITAGAVYIGGSVALALIALVAGLMIGRALT